MFAQHAKSSVHGRAEDAISMLCGDAGILAVSALINLKSHNVEGFTQDLSEFSKGIEPSLKMVVNKHGSDEILFGRAGYLSGVFHLNKNLP